MTPDDCVSGSHQTSQRLSTAAAGVCAADVDIESLLCSASFIPDQWQRFPISVIHSSTTHTNTNTLLFLLLERSIRLLDNSVLTQGYFPLKMKVLSSFTQRLMSKLRVVQIFELCKSSQYDLCAKSSEVIWCLFLWGTRSKFKLFFAVKSPAALKCHSCLISLNSVTSEDSEYNTGRLLLWCFYGAILLFLELDILWMDNIHKRGIWIMMVH